MHAAVGRDVRVLFPMMLGGHDLKHAIEVLREVAEEQGVERLPPVGAMIETPSAVFSIQEILNRADFVSIGTNDLTQFMLAADRNALEMMEDYTVLHPAVLRAIHYVADAAREKGRPVSVCGEAAGDPRVACLLVGLGVRELSMSPMSAARVRQMLRCTGSVELERLARSALQSESPEQVRRLLVDLPGP